MSRLLVKVLLIAMFFWGLAGCVAIPVDQYGRPVYVQSPVVYMPSPVYYYYTPPVYYGAPVYYALPYYGYRHHHCR